MLRELDIPPLWLAICIALAWGLDYLVPGLGFGWHWSRLLGQVLIGAGLVAMALALWAFLRARTTFVPRRTPSAFLQGGIYRISRNPIYLGDALVLAGLILHWDVLPALVLVFGFTQLITRRYILGEEAGLRAAFGAAYVDWSAKVRRWI